MIAKEGLPGLQWPTSPGYHIDRSRGLGYIDAELEQLAVNLGGAPQLILKAHSSDEVPHFFGNPRPAAGRTGSPSPGGDKALSMPTHDSLGPHDGYRIKDARA